MQDPNPSGSYNSDDWQHDQNWEDLKAAATTGNMTKACSMTKRCLKPETIAHGPDGDVLILARWGRVTLLGRLWDEEYAERARSPCVQMGENPVPLDNKGGITASKTDAPNPRSDALSSAAQR